MGLAQQALEVAPVKVRELKKYFSLSDYTDLKKMIPQICLYFSRYLNRCNRFIIGVIKDFLAFQKS
jgi:hypothetical protein